MGAGEKEMRNTLLLMFSLLAESQESCWVHTRCKCSNKTGRVSHTTSALHREATVLHKCLSPSIPDPLLYLQEATSPEKVGSQLNYGPTPLLASNKHRCAHCLFKLDISANLNWDSIPKTQHLFSFQDTRFLTVPRQRQPQGS